MTSEIDVQDPRAEVRQAGTSTPASFATAVADPLRSLRLVKWLTRLFVYPGIALLIPLDHSLWGLTWQQALSVHLGGFLIATIAIEAAFGQAFKLRKHAAYPNVLLVELGKVQTVAGAAQQALAVIHHLLGLRASFLALGVNPDVPMTAVSGMSRTTAQRFLQVGMSSVQEAMRTQCPVPFRSPGLVLPETMPGSDERLVFVPVVGLQQPIGVLALVGHKGNGDLKDNELLAGIGSALGLSLENLRQEEELRESERRLRQQNEVLAALAKSKTLNRGEFNAAVKEITEAAGRTLGVERASVWLYSDDRSKIHCADLYELSANRHSVGLKLAAAQHPSYFKALEEERIIAADDARSDARTREFTDAYLVPLGITSVIYAPVRLGGQLVGVVCNEQVGPVRKWSPLEQNFAGSMADLVSMTMETYERKRATEELRESESRFRALVESAFEGIVISDNGKILEANESFARLFGYELPEVIGMSASDATTPKSAELIMANIEAGIEKPYEITGVRKDGTTFNIEVVGKNCLYNGRKARITAFRDITEIKRAEETIRHLAYHDPLTDLPNRMLFEDRLAVALAQARRKKRMVAVMFLDLDRFKVVNDTVGHALGDRLLKGVGERLMGLVRDGDSVARVGGDEFTVLLPDVARPEDTVEVAERILDVLRQPWVLNGHEFHISTSIGIAMYPNDGEDAESLLRNADTAMYRAKDGGRDNYKLYTPTMNARIAERLALENSLRHGLERGEFVVYYQPQVDIGSGRIVGMEALVRWQHPERGLISPAEFIPVAEETGLIVPLGAWVLRIACAQNKAWQEAGVPPMRMAVNLSARQFQLRDLIDTVAQVLEETRLDPQFLQLEITEGVAMQDVEFTVTMLRELREMGVQIAMDDFGTGHSSLSYLKRFPINILKIDQSFVRDLTVDPDDAAIASTIIMMAHNLKLRVIAEGVETEDQLAFLRERQCDEMQGYLFSKPAPAEAFEAMLRQGGDRPRARRPVRANR